MDERLPGHDQMVAPDAPPVLLGAIATHEVAAGVPEVLQGESPHSYLMRASVTLNEPESMVSLVRPAQRTDHRDAQVLGVAASLPEIADIPASDRQARNTQSLETLLSLTDRLTISAPVESGSVGAAAYDQTQRDRRLFARGSGSAGHETYASSLYAATADAEVQAHVARHLDGKRLVNLGGGNSRLRRDLEETGVSPASVKNVEPYPSQRLLDNPDDYDDLVVANPGAKDFMKTSGLQPKEADEVVAVFSVPAYLGTAEEVENLFTNIGELLAPGGVARISHLGIVRAAPGDARIAALLKSVHRLAANDYLVEVIPTQRGINLFITAPGDTPKI